MTTRKVAVVDKALVGKGMVRSTVKGKDHHYYTKKLDGTANIITHISHGASEIDDYLAGLMRRQCYLFLKEFWALVDCPLKEKEWDEKIRARLDDPGWNPNRRA